MESKEGFLGEKFVGYGTAPVVGAWANISAQLDKEEKKRRAIIWWFTGAAASILVVLSILQFNGEKTLLNAQFGTTLTRENKSLYETTKDENIRTGLVKNSTSIQEEISSHADEKFNNYSAYETKEIEKSFKESDAAISSKLIVENNDLEKDLLSIDLMKLPLLDEGRLDLAIERDYPSLEINKPSVKNSWFFELGVDLAKQTDIGIIEYSFTSMDIPPPDTTSGTAMSPASSLGTITETKRFRPIGISFNIGKEIGRRFEFRTGLGLNYYYEKTTENGLLSARQHTFSLALPVGIRSNFLVKKRLQLFTEMGGMIEMPFVRRNVSYQNYTFAAAESADKSTTFDPSLRVALGVKGGLKYMLNENKSLSIGPELRYYLGNPNLSASSSNSSPWWVGLGVGYRF